ncbi:MAG: outer membrane beta-barrel protein [Deltaproteobacteria bacterium]|nr:outer membrane beta-barrel protein [Deltaproteobacteria bacterium]
MIAATAAACILAAPARAQQLQSTTTTTTTETRAAQRTEAYREPAKSRPEMREALLELEEGSLAPDYSTAIGVSVLPGGGPTGFLETDARQLTDVGGSWDARLTIGTRSVLGVELGYIGASQNISAAGLDTNAYLLKNGAEAAAHLSILNGPVQPYLLAGVGWTNYRLTNDGFNNTPIPNADNMARFPLGAGVGVHLRGLVLDGRGVIRPVTGDNLLDSSGGKLHPWEGKMMAGWEFAPSRTSRSLGERGAARADTEAEGGCAGARLRSPLLSAPPSLRRLAHANSVVRLPPGRPCFLRGERGDAPRVPLDGAARR